MTFSCNATMLLLVSMVTGITVELTKKYFDIFLYYEYTSKSKLFGWG